MKRRSFIKTVGMAAAGTAGPVALPGFVRAGRAVTGTKPPNILVIIVDQLRFPQGSFDQDLLDAAAPNIAALRRQSVSFDAHYAAATMCSPSRATMLTGLYTHQTGMFLTNVHGRAHERPRPSLNPAFPTWGRILSSAQFGYQTFWWGKWHLSHNDQTSFDYVSRYGFSGGLPLPSPNGAPGQGLEVDPQITQIFKNWLNSYAGSGPWCTTVSLVNPHDIAWFPKYSRSIRDENNPPHIPQFHTGLPANFENWPQAILSERKPGLQQAWVLLADRILGAMPLQIGQPAFPKIWFQFLDLYYLLTQYVDRQVGAILSALAESSAGDNTIVLFTADHGEYAGAHGLRNKGFAVYEESIHVPLYIKDPTGKFVPGDQVGTSRNELTSHVDLVPLLMNLASGANEWRKKIEFSHLAGRANLVEMLSDPNAPGRDFILHTCDENIPEEAARTGLAHEETAISNIHPPGPVPQRPAPSHVIGYRTKTAKLGIYSYFSPGSIDIVQQGQEAELYDYAKFGTAEIINNALRGSAPQTPLYNNLYDELFNPDGGALVAELRQPLPAPLGEVQRLAMADYLAYEASL